MLSLCLPYYKNPGMLAEQFRVWAGYPYSLKAQLEIVLVDDASPQPALDVPRPDGLPPLRIYRVLEDILWHQHGARNLAAKEAACPWLFLTDIDHVVPAKTLEKLLPLLAESRYSSVYTFGRVDAPDLLPTLDGRGEKKPHCNTFAMTKAHFWTVGGYDEDCVGYGTDSYFRRRLLTFGATTHLPKLHIIRYPREVIADANTTPPGIDPKEFRAKSRRRQETKVRLQQKAQTGEGPKVLAFAWERVL